MTIDFELQVASGSGTVPTADEFERWLAAVLDERGDCALAIRVVDGDEMQALNSRYRGQDRPTNVLSFPADLPEAVRGSISPEPLGDIVICAPVVEAEAKAQNKPVVHHWAHLTIHGLLHLVGHDHGKEAEAQAMETLEIDHLSRLGIPDPYNR